MLHFDLVPAHAANEVMMVRPGQFIPQMTVARLREPREAVLRQKSQRPIHGRLGQPREIFFRRLVYFAGGEVFAGMAQYMQDRHPLWSDAKTA